MSRLADLLSGLDRAVRVTPRVGGLPSLPPSPPASHRWNATPLLAMVVGMLTAGGAFWLVASGQTSILRSGAQSAAPVASIAARWEPAPPAPRAEPGAPFVSASPPGSAEELPTPVDRAMALARDGALGDAATAFRQAIAREPRRADLWNNLGVVLVRAGAVAAGIEAFREAVALDPADGEAHRNLAVALDRRGRAGEAVRHYRAFLGAVPSDHPDRPEVERRLRARPPRGAK